MRLWVLNRLGDVGYDEYDSKIVRAQTERDAREIANQRTGDEGGVWTNKKLVTCVKLRVSGEPGEILGSFNAG